MSKPPVAKKKMGNIELALWEGEHEGKKIYSYSIQKNRFNKAKNKWETSNFFTPADMPNLLALVQDTVLSNIKKEVIEPKKTPVEKVKEEFYGQEVDSEIPF